MQATPDGQFAGDIYNAESGKFYSVSLWRESSERLKLKGCLIKLLCQTQTWQRTFDVDPARLNVNGGAIAIGHPIGCTGTRITVTLVHEMLKRNTRHGVATLCVSGGLGMALALESVV